MELGFEVEGFDGLVCSWLGCLVFAWIVLGVGYYPALEMGYHA